MTATATFKRKTVSLDADLTKSLEEQATNEGRSLSNLVNFRLRQMMQTSKSRRRKEAVK